MGYLRHFTLIMFKSRRKKKQEKEQKRLALAAEAEALDKKSKSSLVYHPLEEIKVARDFRTSVIVPQLQDLASPFRNDLIPTSLPKQQFSSPLASRTTDRSGPEKPTTGKDSNQQYQDLAAWRALRNQSRYSNAMFGGKQRGPKMIPGRKAPTHQSKQENINDSEPQNVYEVPICPAMTPPRSSDIHPDLYPSHRVEECEYEDEDSDVENYFFKDFAPGHEKIRSQTPTRQRSKRYSARARSNKPTRQFDVLSFAQHLHENRLSVAQPRATSVVMTEEDERELQILLQRTPPESQENMPVYPAQRAQQIQSAQQVQPIQQRKPATKMSLPIHSEKTLQETKPNKRPSQRKKFIPEKPLETSPVQRSALGSNSFEDIFLKNAPTNKDNQERENPQEKIEVIEDKVWLDITGVPNGVPARYSNSTASSSDTPKSIENIQSDTLHKLTQKQSLPYITPPITPPEIPNRDNRVLLNKKPSLLSQKLNRANSVEHNNINTAAIGRPIHPPSALRNMQLPSLNSSSYAFSSPRTAPLPPSNNLGRSPSSSSNFTSTSSSSIQDSATSISSSNTRTRSGDSGFRQPTLVTITDISVSLNKSIDSTVAQRQRNNGHRRSVSLNTSLAPNIMINRVGSTDNERDPAGRTPNVSSPLVPQSSVTRNKRDDDGGGGVVPGPPKPQGLFGTLRQVGGINRSQGSFRGLIRNFSTGNHRQQESGSDDGAPGDSFSESRGMSRAAMAVIHHSVVNSKPVEEPGLDKPRPHVLTANNSIPSLSSNHQSPNESIAVSKTGGGTRLISQLLAKAIKPKKTKKAGAGADLSLDINSSAVQLPRSQVVRRTIIYVQPDSIPLSDFLDGQDVPPLPCPLNPVLSQATWKSKKLDENISTESLLQSSSSASVVPPTRPRRNGDSPGIGTLNRAADQLSPTTPCLQGLELREMSDGSVEWGLVKKKGNRKSFYRPSGPAQLPPSSSLPSPAFSSSSSSTSVPFSQTRLLVEDEIEDDVEDEDWFDNHLLAIMASDTDLPKPNGSNANAPAIPRRSPRRPQANCINTPESTLKKADTDIYYAPTMTLPNLLHMMASNNDGDLLGEKTGKSIEDELDDMMKMFASH
ncbi:hypothetical protein F4703DRAFT_1792770 [Phycomyces blakesleeanus]